MSIKHLIALDCPDCFKKSFIALMRIMGFIALPLRGIDIVYSFPME